MRAPFDGVVLYVTVGPAISAGEPLLLLGGADGAPGEIVDGPGPGYEHYQRGQWHLPLLETAKVLAAAIIGFVTSFGVPSVLSYQFFTMSTPSGFRLGRIHRSTKWRGGPVRRRRNPARGGYRG